MFWYDVIDFIEGHVEDNEMCIRKWIPGQPHPTLSKKVTLILWATECYWQCLQESMSELHDDNPVLIAKSCAMMYAGQSQFGGNQKLRGV
jgi:hypothetical protein